jgi:hypothetical protein
VERQSDGQDNIEIRNRVCRTCPGENFGNVIVQEVIIFENSQHTNIGYEADVQVLFPSFTGSVFDEYSGNIVDDDGEKKDEDIGRDEKHVKNTTSNQKQCPPELVGQHKVKGCNNYEEEEEFKGVKQHSLGSMAGRIVLNFFALR